MGHQRWRIYTVCDGEWITQSEEDESLQLIFFQVRNAELVPLVPSHYGQDIKAVTMIAETGPVIVY